MAGDWIKMRTNLWDDPRITFLCAETNQPEAIIIGGLYWLWSTADQHTENGFMQRITLNLIDRKTCINGFGLALTNVGWLKEHPEGLLLVNFEEHNGSSAKKRCQTAKRVGSHRADATKKLNQSKCNALPVTGALTKEEEEKSTTTSTRKKFLLGYDWQPSDNFPTCLALAGINPEIHLTASAHTEFIAFWSSRDCPLLLTQNEWDHKFLKAIQNNHQRSRTGGNNANGISTHRKLTAHERLFAANATAAGQ